MVGSVVAAGGRGESEAGRAGLVTFFAVGVPAVANAATAVAVGPEGFKGLPFLMEL